MACCPGAFTAGVPAAGRDPIGANALRRRSIAECAVALEDVRERVPRRLYRNRLAHAGGNPHVEVTGIGGDTLDGAALTPEIAGDDAHAGAVVIHDFGDFLRMNVLIARIGHLQAARQVRPELEAVHAAALVALGHLLMEDAATGGHPLCV